MKPKPTGELSSNEERIIMLVASEDLASLGDHGTEHTHGESKYSKCPTHIKSQSDEVFRLADSATISGTWIY